MREIIEPERKIPVVREVDVVIIGGGPAGFIAAVAVEQKTSLCDLDVSILQKRLLDQGAILE